MSQKSSFMSQNLVLCRKNLVLCRECREAYGIYPTVVHTYAQYCDICCDVESDPEVWQDRVVPIGVYDE